MPAPARFLRGVAIVLLLCAGLVPLRPAAALAGIEPGPGKGWLTIASRTRPEDAIAMARQYAGSHPGATVFQSTNGYFAVTLGWSDIGQGQPMLRSLIASGAVPSDSYFTAGARFVRAIWSASNAHTHPLPHLLAATALRAGTAPAPAGQPGYVTGLDASGDNFLSLRTGPGTSNPEIARLRPNTPLTVTGNSGRWLRVNLDNGMDGWAYGKYVALGPAPGTRVPTIGPSAGASVPEIGPQASREPAPQPEPQPEVQPEPPAASRPEVAAAPESPEIRQPKALTDEKRVALVIGNSAYAHTVELPKPRNDAAAMSDKLSSLGFEVISALDGSKTGMEGAVREFVRAMEDADVALFFYAGHGMQVNGTNYLIPVDAKLEDSTALDFETISLDTILNFMNREDRVSIALLDACRDNPLSRRFTRSLGATRSAFIGRGLAAPSTGSGQVLIGFATAPGEVALDGSGSNSPFTTALLGHIGTPGLEIELMLKRVKQEVYETTGKEQEPWHNSALRREFYFDPQ
ncbi:MAG: caspase family protein [Pseudomonadota bacterium]|nr:caspase family protein [Pseudomonadota bacterium]